MKHIKKIFLFLLISCSIWTISMNLLVNGDENDFIIKFEYDEEISLERIEVKVNKSSPVYINGTISQFDNEYYNSFLTNEAGEIKINRPSDFFLIEVNLNTLPNDLTIEEKTIFITNELNVYSIKLYSASDESEDIINNSNVINNINELIACKVENSNLNMCFEDVNAITSLQSMNIEELEWDDIPYSNISSVSNSRFEIIYDSNTMTMVKAQKVLTEIIKVKNFFFQNNTQNSLVLPTSGNGKYKIYLAYYYDINRLYDSNALGMVRHNNGINSYMILNYDLIAMINDFNYCSENSFIAALAHEYAHAMCISTGFEIKQNNKWFTESLAEALSLYYVSSCSINDSYIRDCFYIRIYNYFETSNYTINDISITNREYNVMLFPFYIIQKYGYNVIKEIIINGGIYTNAYDNIDNILRKHNSTLDSFYEEFSIKTADIFSNYTLISTYYRQNYGDIRNKFSVLTHDNNLYKSKRKSINYYSEEYIRLISNSCTNFDAYITIKFTSINNMNVTKIQKGSINDIYITHNLTSTSVTIPQYNFGNSECNELLYIITNGAKNNATVTIDYDIGIVHQVPAITECNEIDLSTTLNDIYALKFVPTSSDLFEIKFENYVGNLPGDVIQIRDINNNAIEKFEIDGFNNYANNVLGVNKFVVKLEYGRTYYIHISYYNLANTTLRILKNYDQIILSERNEYISNNCILSRGDEIKKMVIPLSGYYNFEFTIPGNVVNNFAFLIIKKNGNNIEYIETNIISNANKIREIRNIFLEKDTIIYIGYINYNQDTSIYELTINMN